MPRYINADDARKLLIAEAKQDRSRAYGDHECDIISGAFNQAKDIVCDMPALDLIPRPVPCAECILRDKYGCPASKMHEKGNGYITPPEMEFCNAGKREEQEL